MKIFTPPSKVVIESAEKSVFLGGSIEMGQVEDWQTWLINELKKADWRGVILNPRRADWDSSWKQSIDNQLFKEQVDWELDNLERADLKIFYFHPQTKAPITLMELGLHAREGRAVVCCPEGFWRKGNVDIVCQRFGVKQVENLNELFIEILNLT